MRIVKITLKAILINETDEQKQKIDNCTAIRYSFRRLPENNIKINELVKIISKKYNLNIRQAKDAVKSARQTILYKEMFLNHLIKGEAYQVEILKRNNKYYCHITFEMQKQEVILLDIMQL